MSIIKVTNQPAKKNPCPDLPDDLFALLRERLDKISAALLGAIDEQISAALKGADLKEKEVQVQVVVVDQKEFEKEYSDDLAKNDDDKKKRKEEAASKFKEFKAWTYISDEKTKTIKIKIFCNQAVNNDANDQSSDRNKNLDRLIVHELVHVKIFAMTLLGVPSEKFPTELNKQGKNDGTAPGEHGEDHNDQFSKEIEKLLKKL